VLELSVLVVEGVVSSVWRISWNRCDFKLASSEVIVAIAANFFLMTVIFVVALFNPQVSYSILFFIYCIYL